jgi:amino acid transporter/nucleotide-binding universal stress UspA family protein
LIESPNPKRHLGLLGATGVGVGAIVGGGILALAGVAFAATGPSAILAFGLNGVIALLTALSMAELSSKFPESGGAYTFAKRVMSVDTAFNVGWVVWFASMVAAVLYALGAAYFCLAILADVYQWFGGDGWSAGQGWITLTAIVTMLLVAFSLARKATGGGYWINSGKVIVFGLLIAAGLAAFVGRSPSDIGAKLDPFFSGGWIGLIQAMGYTFIALQGFDLIAAVGGEVRQPERNIPRAMIYSLCIALAIYLPLLLIISTVGIPAGQNVRAAANENPEAIVAIAAENYLGSFGYWLVMIAAVLSMLSALQANVFAASRIAWAMAGDHTLPNILTQINRKRGTPVYAIAVTATIIGAILLVVPNVAAAGAAASLIFLVTFAISHWLAILLRRRSRKRPPPFRAPLFPLVPILGGLCCIALAIFQGIAVPQAGIIAIIWLTIGAILFIGLFARRARILDAARMALNPETIQLRGRRPFVLVPIANPHNAAGLVAVAKSLAPPEIGRALMLSVVTANKDWDPVQDPQPLLDVQSVLGQALIASHGSGLFPETLITVAEHPWPEIARVASAHQCRSMVLGFRVFEKEDAENRFNQMLSQVDCDIVLLRAPENWPGSEARKILVPVAGRGGHDQLLARLIGSLSRTVDREVTFLRILQENASEAEARKARRELTRTARDNSLSTAKVVVVRAKSAVQAVAEMAADNDLTILGVQRIHRREKLFSQFSLQLARATDSPLIFISRRG